MGTRRDSVRRGGTFGALVVGCTVMGALSLGGDCGGASSAVEADGASVASSASSSSHPSRATTSGTSETTVTGGSSGFDVLDAGAAFDGFIRRPAEGGQADAKTAAALATDGGRDAGAQCFLDNEPCGDGGAPFCCNGTCVLGACGGALAEGEPCDYESGHPKSGTAPCLGTLTCNAGTCGTSACAPEGSRCGPDVEDGGVVCCNDDCNGTTCGN